MKTLKKILAGIIAGSLIFAGGGEVFANPDENQIKTEINAWAKSISEWSGVSEKEILNAVEAGKTYEDIDFAAMLSKISGKSLTQILNMKADWHDVMQRLGITREKYEAAHRELMIKSIAKSGELDEATVKNLLEDNYNPRDIEIAGRLAKASGKNVQEVLDSKKINQCWIDVAENLNVDKALVNPKNAMEEGEPLAPRHPNDR